MSIVKFIPGSREKQYSIYVSANGDITMNGMKVNLAEANWDTKNSDVRVFDATGHRLVYLWTRGVLGTRLGRNMKYTFDTSGTIDYSDGRNVPTNLKGVINELTRVVGAQLLDGSVLKQFATMNITDPQKEASSKADAAISKDKRTIGELREARQNIKDMDVQLKNKDEQIECLIADKATLISDNEKIQKAATG